MYTIKNNNIARKYVRSIVTLVLSSMIFTILPGCATMFGNNNRDIKVESKPEGASIYLDGKECGVTPAVVKLPKRIYGGKTLILKKEGYEDQSILIDTKFQQASLLNVAFPVAGGILLTGAAPRYGMYCVTGLGIQLGAGIMLAGLAIDGATGNLVKVNPEKSVVNVEMKKVEEKNSN